MKTSELEHVHCPVLNKTIIDDDNNDDGGGGVDTCGDGNIGEDKDKK